MGSSLNFKKPIQPSREKWELAVNADQPKHARHHSNAQIEFTVIRSLAP